MSPNSSSPPKIPSDTALHEASLQVKGNAPLFVKQKLLSLMHVFVLTPDKAYGAKVGQRLNLVQVDIRDNHTQEGDGGQEVAETVFETVVVEEMTNPLGVLHGGSAAYIIDFSTTSPILALGVLRGKLSEYASVSQSMNIIWHYPIRLGTKIRIISTSMAVNGKIKTARCEIRNGDRLCISATHSLSNSGKGSLLKDGILVKL